ncbi:hypothetical protein DNJ95_09665 [Stutzerimonas kirkiae]|uniref:Cytochrome P450 n=1 Tax=Stutzerimonas kirkiae TaxID=2211392 RepID=A0A4Q9RBP0_9GAMM|nr:cytochrome P450 [Stutzerimonas kirkiae]TBU98122.1 hypothetical protein DNJ96_06765 [Stutzerimonas kirkiae]TBV02363.1 hypothetical protein DNJ95_09665 [Stutzerimonas kirkiae]TBV14674.1 hypothetical protein DNK01_08940 [Stutzerimonas kirkiae]
MKGKFDGNARVHIVEDYEAALPFLSDPRFIVPDLGGFLERLEQHGQAGSFRYLRLFVEHSPFFLEGAQHKTLRGIASQYFSHRALKRWEPFILDELQGIVDALDVPEFEVVSAVGARIFTRVAKPILGLAFIEDERFDVLVMGLQRLVEPMQSLSRLRRMNEELGWLLDKVASGVGSGHACADGVLPRLLADAQSPLSLEGRMALAVTLYAAMAPLAQTVANVILRLCERPTPSPFDADRFIEDIASHIHGAVAPHYVHRVALEDCRMGDLSIGRGDTVMIDIEQAVLLPAADSGTALRSFSFGHGAHYCLGAVMSKFIIAALIPRLLGRFGHLTLVRKELDINNHIANALGTLVVRGRA